MRLMGRSPQRQRRDIFVESQTNQNLSPVGAAYSDDVAPDGAFEFLRWISTKMTALRA
jgi:hypothetical protein